jgi:hypothetical protein
MRESPSIIPGIDRDVYLVLDDFGRIGWAWRETDVEDTDYETVINDLLEGQFANPVRVIGFNIEGEGRKTCRASYANGAPPGLQAGEFLQGLIRPSRS